MKTEKNIKIIITGSNDISELQKAFDAAVKSLPNVSGTIYSFGYWPLKVGNVTVQFMTDHDEVVIDPLPYRNEGNDYPGGKNYYVLGENEYCDCVASVCINDICLNCKKKSKGFTGEISNVNY